MYNPVCPKCKKELTLPEAPSSGKLICPYCNTVQQLLIPGTVLGNYKLIRLISCANMGCIYLAEQTTVGRKVALKVLDHAKAQNQQEVEKFLNEARNTVQFAHPNIVCAIDAGQFDGVYCIAMQYVEGENLETTLEKGKIYTPTEALRIILTIAEALKSIWHRTKMFHKDIKPANIMITPEGDPMLLDMGIAQNLGEGSLEEGVIEGTPLYMSPEQARGEKLSWSTDCYSLGATLFHMVTGKVPYWHEDVNKILEMHCFAPLPNPDKVYLRNTGKNIRFPDNFRRILERMLAKDQDARYRSWEDAMEDMTGTLILLEELQSVQEPPLRELEGTMESLSGADENDEKSPPSAAKKFWHFLAGHTTLTACIILFLAVLFVLTLYWHLSCKKDVKQAEELIASLKKLPLSTQEENLKKGKNFYGKLQELSANSLPVNLFYAGKIRKVSLPLFAAEKKYNEEKELLTASEKLFQNTAKRVQSLLEEGEAKVYFPGNFYRETAVFDLSSSFLQMRNLIRDVKEEYSSCREKLRNTPLFQYSGFKKKHDMLLAALERNITAFETALQQEKKAFQEEARRLAEKKKKELALARRREREKSLKKAPAAKEIRKVEGAKNKKPLLSPSAAKKMSNLVLRELIRKFHSGFPAEYVKAREKLTISARAEATPEILKLEKENLAFADRLHILYREGENFYKALADSEKQFRGFVMPIPSTYKSGTLYRIRKGELLLANGYDNWKVMLPKLPPHTMERLAAFAAGKNGNLSPYLFAFYLRLKAYDKALELVRKGSLDRTITGAFLKEHLKVLHKRYRGRVPQGLIRKYKNTPEYKRIFRKKVKGKKRK